MADEFLEGIMVNSHEMPPLADGIAHKKCDKIFAIDMSDKDLVSKVYL